eukprot:TRINITY_DN1313_c0_g1_i1.p1 TRINITY_DN1313_c0_g1~~TRINITY_DN1313_c0_g1_i1.p1  ORF type:complete len:1082 (+),score=278.04 TRINITY_DN1313_c0_g1_i1:478-3246(+)
MPYDMLDTRFPQLLIGSAHNDVEWFTTTNDSVQERKMFSCASKCLVTSMAMHGDSPESVLVASGTIYNEIWLWKLEDGAPFISLKGHEGVIYRVVWPHFDPSMIVSTSDDRTIRTWKLQLTDEPCGSEMSCIYAHRSRIWDLYVNDKMICSAGEDATARVWEWDSAAPSSERFKLVDVLEGHEGRNIWRLACHEGLRMFATAGNDGSIKLFPFSSRRERRCIEFAKEEKARALCHVSEERLIVASSNGRILRYDWGTDDLVCAYDSRQELGTPFMVSCLSYFPRSDDEHLIALGTLNKSVLILDRNGNVRNVLPVHFQQVADVSMRNRHLLVCGKCGNIALFNISEEGDFVLAKTFSTEYDDKQKPTISCCLYDDRWGVVVIGTVRGHIVVIHMESGERAIWVAPKSEHHIVKKITPLCANEICAAGYDGKVRTFRIVCSYDVERGTCHLEVSQEKSSHGYSHFIQDIHIEDSPNGEDISFVGGVLDKHVVLFDEKRKYLLAKKYGGSNRQMFSVHYHSGSGRSSDEEEKDMVKYSLCIPFMNTLEMERLEWGVQKMVLGVSYHGMRINDGRITEFQGKKIILSAGEDTTLRIVGGLEEELFFSSQTRTTELKCLDFLIVKDLDDESMIVGVGGKKERLELWSFDSLTHGRLLYSGSPWRNSIFRITSLAIFYHPAYRHGTYNPLVICFGTSEGVVHIFFLAESLELQHCSTLKYHNGPVLSLQHLRLNDDDDDDDDDDRVFLLSGGTEGLVCIWEIPSVDCPVPTKPISVIRDINLSGINSLDATFISKSSAIPAPSLLIAVGGDDQSVTAVVASVPSFDVIEMNRLESVHNSGVEGVKILSINRILSCGSDQRLVILALKTTYMEGRLQLKLAIDETVMHEVLDTSSLDAIQTDENCWMVCAFGMGMELFTMEEKKEHTQ